MARFLEDEPPLGIDELARSSGLAIGEIVALVELGVFDLAAAEEAPRPWRFTGRALALARRAARLRTDFDLDPAGLALALTYLERIGVLEARVRELECQLLR